LVRILHSLHHDKGLKCETV